MFISENNLAALLGTSAATIKGWTKKGVYRTAHDSNGIAGVNMEDLRDIEEIAEMLDSKWEEELKVVPIRDFTSIELFAGGGGLALGMEKAGFKHILLNEFDRSACNTLRVNRPEWNVIEGDIRNIDFTPLYGKIDFLSGGFPCQAFSYAGKQGGFNDIRGTMFFELARAVKEIRPRVFMGENVKGLVSHDNGKTFKTICNVISELGYTLIEPKVLKAIKYQVPQKRERIILIAIRNDIAEKASFKWPSPFHRIMTLKDAFYKGIIYDKEVPASDGASYPVKKKKVLELVPQGGDWRNLPEEVAKDYMGGSWLLGGGKTGMARRLSLEEPSLTLTCSPCQKQTERCHPLETRPLSVREYARIQTFPDDWLFQGTMSDRYKQIGNAVPVNLAWAIGRSLIRLFNDIEKISPSATVDCSQEVKKITNDSNNISASKNASTTNKTSNKVYKQLNIFDLLNQFGENSILDNTYVSESFEKYETLDCFVNQNPDMTVLISLITKSNCELFNRREAFVYYTGKRFPSTVELKELRFFIPYIKGKGIRDLYIIKKIRVGNKNNAIDGEKVIDPRLIFEIEYLGQLYPKYVPVRLDIWHTYTQTTLNNIKCNS